MIMLYQEIFEAGNVLEKPEGLVVKRKKTLKEKQHCAWVTADRDGHTMNKLEEEKKLVLVDKWAMARASTRGDL